MNQRETTVCQYDLFQVTGKATLDVGFIGDKRGVSLLEPNDNIKEWEDFPKKFPSEIEPNHDMRVLL